MTVTGASASSSAGWVATHAKSALRRSRRGRSSRGACRLGIDLPAEADQAAQGWTDAGNAAVRLETICAKADELKADLDRRTESVTIPPISRQLLRRQRTTRSRSGCRALAPDSSFSPPTRSSPRGTSRTRSTSSKQAAPDCAARQGSPQRTGALRRSPCSPGNAGPAQLKEWARLSDVCGMGIEEVELDRYKVSAPHMEDTYLRDRINLYRVGAFAAWKLYDDGKERTKNLGKVLERAELSKAHSGLGWLFSPGNLLATGPAEVIRGARQV